MGNQHTRSRLSGFASSLMRVCLVIAAIASGSVYGYAQERTISGVITDGGGNLS